ncbi:MAG: DNA repair protein RecN [Vicinamibacteria bacterium]|nr:DNA repair protein RecN [Vicinamibacteria bacterium]
MLRVLRIENLAVVASAEIEFGPGLNLLTGETGAGKSIVVDALGLVCGERADGDLVRTGEEKGTIEAIFDVPRGFGFEALGLGIEEADGEVAIRREILASGRSRAMINGVTVSLAGLKSVGQHLVQIHGQHLHHALLNAEFHLSFLDRFAGLDAKAERARILFGEAQAADAALRDFVEKARQFGRERDTLRFQVDEIRKADLRAGEEEELREERSRLRNSERLGELTSEAGGLLDGTEDDPDNSLLSKMRSLGRRLDEISRLDPSAVRESFSRHGEVLSLLNDWSADLADYVSSLDAQPGRIDEVESRLATLERLKKKYGSSIDEIMSFLSESESRLNAIDDPEAEERRLAKLSSTAWATYAAAAAGLSKERRSVATKLQKAVARELGELAMAQCRFEVRFEPASAPTDFDWRAHGLETGEFFLSANPGEELKPLKSVASGGELSRALLALQSLLNAHPSGAVVFDEVDAGIGGAVAEAVGRRLARVARDRQVLCVTHLAQVSAFADRHYVVEKRVVRGRTITEVREVDGRDRVREVARMLAGEVVTGSAEKNAEELIGRVRRFDAEPRT